MLSAITAVFGKMFGTDKALDSIVNGVSNGLDKLVYTSEEKADDAKIERAEARKMIIAWLANTSGQNIARRIIALSVVGTWLCQYITEMLLNIAAIWIIDNVRIIASAKVVGDYADKMSGAVMMVLAFYFAAPYMGDVIQGAMNKFNRNKNA